MIRFSPLLPASILVGALAVPSASTAQVASRPMEAGIRWVASESASPLTVSGIVVDADSGHPLAGVVLGVSGVGGAGAGTGEDGRFVLPVPEEGPAVIQVVALGYDRLSTAVDISTVGVLAQVTLRRTPVPICERMWCPDCPPRGIPLVVRDLVTGEPPESAVSVHVTIRGELHDAPTVTTRSPVGGPQETWVEAPRGIDGPFQVVVSAPGYSPWVARDIWLEYANCAWAPKQHVWLLPR